ncbi:MAG: RnfABCDGE type electron transport complex subunit B [Halorhodospira halophila]|uniref:RnfABCDGE type electron transport complex subunit B n=1 Tax=Halorhodospira TaxID=85108 RepID=UPI001913AA37|nr:MULTISPECIES: RnfABCDGE type electron transport complex subunit B [Halorhodospira]MBK5936937.1 Fe-S cluster protein [Halorhodospira halophila]MBK5942382.1 Fe-S cluster protein [Halorhodospira halophila]MCC3750690.1 RnfABCDGE type electron transport complex subunit B [Halorhodospira halophila]MCG5528166.1 RnfABCDGE type electron transport complex subunit B [Halorhodospira halophila]MCG5531934.1 RnfABCDGE type electron transport complex subunit B [Halorhodospira sp. 9621]
MTQIALAGGVMASLGILLAAMLAVANRRLYVYEDPRIDEIEDLLPRANCGACGVAGCRPFAEALINGDTQPSRCTVNSPELNQQIADLLGVSVGDQERLIARLACAGGTHVAATRARYEGLKSCRAAALVAGGGKGCVWGCLGLGDCEDECGFDAIELNRYGLPIVDAEKCTGCGDCVEICPKDLFSLQPESHRLWINCRNQDPQDEAESHCEVVCTACGRCAADAPEGLIRMENNLAVIDYSKNDLASPVAIERCPTGAIVWLEDGEPRRGAGARKITRKEPLPRMEPLPRV